MPVVFFSYSHDSDEHGEKVLELAQRLRRGGLEVRLDQYDNGAPPGGIQRWMLDRLEEADFVLVICTATYHRRFRGRDRGGEGMGSTFEGLLITQAIYESYGESSKYIPICFASDQARFIPEPLRHFRRYLLDRDHEYESLFERLTGQQLVEAERVGALELGPRISPSRLGHVADRLFGREKRLRKLQAAWKNPNVHIVTLVAWGGAGKTSLVAKFADWLGRRDYDGAAYFDWSFYSQGTRDASNSSADAFVDAALRFFGDAETADSPKSAADKGARLATLIGARKTLLILDGLEPLQYPPGPLAGDLKDPAVRALLRGLAQRNAGLCLVTTRERVVELERWEVDFAPRWELEQLEVSAGVALLKSLGVRGEPADFEDTVLQVGGHALTLSLLGRFLERAHQGDLRRRDRVEFADMQQLRGGRHAFRVMQAYENWLETGTRGGRQLAVLRLIGLFDRIASSSLLEVLRASPAIVGLTEPLVGLGDEDWNLVLADLAEVGLVARQDAGVDAHPLVREYFATRLGDGPAWREAHHRLFHHLQATTGEKPEGLAALQPLYQAVHHGCQAGRYEEAYEVYHDRILRGTSEIDGGFYSLYTLGAFGADLGLLSCFFEAQWRKLVPDLPEIVQAWMLSITAFVLRALGRLGEAVEPLRAGGEYYCRVESWSYAAKTNVQLSELELNLGDIDRAVVDATQSVLLADRGAELDISVFGRIALAGARHQRGDRLEAEALFREAERLQAKNRPAYPLVYGQWSFRLCDLLLEPVETAVAGGRLESPGLRKICVAVEGRVTRTLSWLSAKNWLLDVALEHLALGRAQFYRALLEGRAEKAEFTGAAAEVEKAVDGLRAAGSLDHLPRGLLTRAWIRHLSGDGFGAESDLEEATEIAERGSMRLHLADIALYRARLFGARAALAEAKRLVEECGYGRRLPEIGALEAGWD